MWSVGNLPMPSEKFGLLPPMLPAEDLAHQIGWLLYLCFCLCSELYGAQIMKHQLCWAGHCVWMEDSCIPRQMLYWQLSHDKRSQRKRFKDFLKVHFKREDIDPANWLRIDWSGTSHCSKPWPTLRRTVSWTRVCKTVKEKGEGSTARTCHPPWDKNLSHLWKSMQAQIRLISHHRTHST